MFSFKNLFSSHSRALLLSFLFLFQWHLRFFGKWFVISWQTVGTLLCSLLYRKYQHYWNWPQSSLLPLNAFNFTKQLWEKVPTTTRHNYYCSFTKPDQFFQKKLRQFLFIWYGHANTKKFLIKLTRRNTDGQNVHHQRVTQRVQAVHPCERCCPTSLSCLPLGVQKQNFSSVVAASGFVWQNIALLKPSGVNFQLRWQTNLSSPIERSASKRCVLFCP